MQWPKWMHCATCGGEMPGTKWEAHNAYHEARGDFAVQADAIYLRPPEWSAPHSWLEARELGWTELQWAQVEASRAQVERMIFA
jgi:hypothetical protein